MRNKKNGALLLHGGGKARRQSKSIALSISTLHDVSSLPNPGKDVVRAGWVLILETLIWITQNLFRYCEHYQARRLTSDSLAKSSDITESYWYFVIARNDDDRISSGRLVTQE